MVNSSPADGSTLLSRLRTTALFCCLTLCVGLSIFWGSSYSAFRSYHFTWSETQGGLAACWQGSVTVAWFTDARIRKSHYLILSDREVSWTRAIKLDTNLLGQPGLLPVTFYTVPGGFGVTFSLGILVLFVGAIVVLLRRQPKLRFSMREMLIATSLVAVVFGGIALMRLYPV